MLNVKHISAGYHGTECIHDVCFDVPSGSITGILGCNGSGKTTLLKAICGLIPHQGITELNGSRIDHLPAGKLAACCGYIPQRGELAADLPVLDVVLMGFYSRLGLLGQPTSDMKEKAAEMLNKVGLASRMQDSFDELSEGQKQLCILARAMVTEPALLLMDEPESALDVRMRYAALNMIKKDLSGQRCALVTLHDPQLALNLCDQLVIVEQGRVHAVLRPESDSGRRLEEGLGRIYGPVTVVRCRDRNGKLHWVLLKEEER